ncbi:hypothetical protein BBJ28_00026050 [Nothophytophthora sp. Chile5]|nr:hypothetical protein BBJ28_00026050 [Nothophytophthora sp. Chile5]
MSNMAWESPEADMESSEEDTALVDVLERCMQELGALCSGLEAQQLDGDTKEAVGDDADPLASLEEMAIECKALLACLEAGDLPCSMDEVPQEGGVTALASLETKEEAQVQRGGDVLLGAAHEEQSTDPPRHEALVLELDSFADELQDLMSRLGGSEEEGGLVESPLAVSTPSRAIDKHQQQEEEEEEVEKNEPQCGGGSETSLLVGAAAATQDMSPPPPKTARDDKGVQRYKRALALHVKRLSKRKLRRGGLVTHRYRNVTAPAPAADQHPDGENSATLVWSKFQSMSFQQHITRQHHARLRTQQAMEVQRQKEAARSQHAVKPALLRHHTTNRSQAAARASPSSSRAARTHRSSYLGHFWSDRGQAEASGRASSSSSSEPKYLCAVYLYGLRRLGTTFITFSSLLQLEERVRARFAIETIVNIYRESSSSDGDAAAGQGNRRDRQVRKLQRVTSLEQVTGGDTLCVTQDAYEDMAILSDWMKKRQRIVHGFQQQVLPPSIAETASTQEPLTLPKQRSYIGGAINQQVWDSNGRSVGVKAQLSIFNENL